MRPVRISLITLLLAIAGGALGACSHAGSSAAQVKRHAAGDPTGRAGDADGGLTDLVSAVSSGGAGNGAVGLKFQLGQRPEAGKPLTVVMRLLANRALEHLDARFHADDGLSVVQGAEFDPQEHIDAGTGLDHNLTVVPDHDGIYTVMATVTTGEAGEANSRSFLIPIVVAAAAAAAADPVPAASITKR